MSRGSVLTLPLTEAMQQAQHAYATGDWARAEQLCGLILGTRADHVGALNLLGVINAQTQRLEEALELLRRAVSATPGNAIAHNNYGNVLRDLHRFREAVDSYDRAIELEPGYAEAFNNRGAALKALGRVDAALDSYARAMALRPDYAQAHYNRGVVLQEAGRVEEALENYARALALQPGYAEAFYNQGLAFRDLRHLEEAVRSYTGALQARPTFAEAYNNRGSVLHDLGRPDEALRDFDRALQLSPGLAEAYINRGHTLAALKRSDEALESYAHALRTSPERPWLYGAWLYAKMQLCDWMGMESLVADLASKVTAGEQAAAPFVVFAVTDALSLQRRAAEIAAGDSGRTRSPLAAIARRCRREIIRLGYYSADFHSHATANLMAELFELHDRKQFEVVALSFGPDKGDPMRERLLNAFDRFVDVRLRSDREAAQISRDLEIDIAVDLKGFTQDARPGIFAHRAAPIQLNYLGYPGTMGADFIDYMVADQVLIPEESRGYYAEKVVYLPNSYQVNDRKRAIAEGDLSRAQLGLAPGSFIFCCFNSPYKINASTFDSWMRILRQTADSSLWLYTDNQITAGNLRKEAERRGVSGSRIIFAQPTSMAHHLARYRAADLFLDTFPCGAHTTASDALWAGLPVLTRLGESLPSRVAASLLHAIGLPELVTGTAKQYEDLAVEMATDPHRMTMTRGKLLANRLTTPLFNAELSTRHLERAYRQMYDRYHAGLSPVAIHVSANE